RLAGKRQRDRKRFGDGSRSRKIAEVDRSGAEPELLPRQPVEPKVDTLDERVLGDDESAAELCHVVLDPDGEPPPLELCEQAELAELRHLHRLRASPITSTGPSPAPRSERPFRTASAATAAARRAASSRSSPRASIAVRVAEWVQPAPCVAATAW